MANLSINRQEFERDIGKITPEMENKILLFGTNIEKITEDEVELEITPNRPDLLSFQGFKRCFLSFLGKSKIREYKVNPAEKNFAVKIDSSVKNIRPYTACAIVKELKLNDARIKELIDIQEKLHSTLGRKRKKIAIGMYPLEKITLPITLKALEPDQIKFIPLEFDKELSGLQILQRHPTGRDYAHLLAGKEKFPIFVDAAGQVLSMPPIINSQNTGKISESTKDVFIECSGFDFEILKKTLNILVCALADMGGKIYAMELSGNYKAVTPNLTPQKMPLSISNTNKLLGLNLNEKQIKTLLEKMGHNYDLAEVESPAWRMDLIHENDLIEEVAIAYGIENFIPEISKTFSIGEESKEERLKRIIAQILSGRGLLEVSSYHLTTAKDQFEKMGLPIEKQKNIQYIPESKTDYNILRKDLTAYLMKIFSENIDSEYPQNIFEQGRVFITDSSGIIEKENLAIATSPGNFTEIKQILLYLFKMLGLDIEFRESQTDWFIEGRCAEILLNGVKIGALGEIHPKVLKNWKIKMPVALCEIALSELFRVYH